MQPIRIGVIGSGSGSNFQALLDAIRAGSLSAEIVLVMSDVPEARILDRAHQAGIPAAVIDCHGYANRFPLAAQQAVASAMMDAGAELICLAGFMRLIKIPLLEAFPQRVINIHPSLLPAFPGLEAWKQALDAGATETGCTVHYVDAGMDTGPIIMQARVPVLPNDTASSLHARIQEQEHLLYPAAIRNIMPTLRA
jgi:phosphoribosylglycinamide formyltransferase-1